MQPTPQSIVLVASDAFNKFQRGATVEVPLAEDLGILAGKGFHPLSETSHQFAGLDVLLGRRRNGWGDGPEPCSKVASRPTTTQMVQRLVPHDAFRPRFYLASAVEGVTMLQDLDECGLHDVLCRKILDEAAGVPFEPWDEPTVDLLEGSVV